MACMKQIKEKKQNEIMPQNVKDITVVSKRKEIRGNNKVESLLRLIQNKEEKDKVIYLRSIDLHTHSDRERRLGENLCVEGKRMTANGYIYIYGLGFYLILPSFIFRV
jgi:hypothetical protein